MLGIEKQRQEDFMLPSTEQQPQIVAHRARRVERVTALHFLLQCAPRHFQHGLQLRVFRLPHAVRLAKICLAGGKQLGEAAEFANQLARQIHRAFAGHAGAQEDRQQLGIG